MPSAPCWSDFVEVPEVYEEKGCDIPQTELRGISIAQLRELADLIEDVFDAGFEYIDKFGVQVTLENINLYHICDLFIKPLSEEYGCSYVEMVADGESQEPSYFVSHWWGTAFFDTIRMLQLHADQRDVHEEEEYYWICSFANCQHNLENLDTLNYLETPFAKAIMSPKCRGTVCILDETKATPLTRSWCVFEAFVSLTHGKTEKERPQTMDFATIVPEDECDSGDDKFNERCAALLFELTSEDHEEDDSPLLMMDETTDHPGDEAAAWFPKNVSRHGMLVNILQAQATEPKDHANILRWVGDRHIQVNAAIQRMFIRPAMLMACTEMGDADFLREIVESGVATKGEALQIAEEEGLVELISLYVGKDEGNERDNPGCLRYLLELGCGPDGNDDDSRDQTPMQNALEYGNYENVRVFLEYGADPNQLNLRKIEQDEIPDDIHRILQDAGVVD